MTRPSFKRSAQLLPLALALSAGASVAATSYQFTAITADNADNVAVFGLNNTGQLVGYGYDASGLASRGFVYNIATASYTWLSGPAGALATSVTGISDTGLVLGAAYSDLVTDPSDGSQYYANQSAFVFDGSSYTTLNVAGLESVYARSISQSGRYVTGYGIDAATGTNRSFVLDRLDDNRVTFVNGNNGSYFLLLAGVDDNGTVVGGDIWLAGEMGPSVRAAVSYNIHTGVLTNHTADSSYRAAYRDVNAKGEVAGWVQDNTLPSGANTFGLVGTLGDTEVFAGPAAPGSTGVILQGNNDAGWISGNYSVGERSYAFLAAPVPEPAPALLLAVGLAALAWRRRAAR